MYCPKGGTTAVDRKGAAVGKMRGELRRERKWMDEGGGGRREARRECTGLLFG